MWGAPDAAGECCSPQCRAPAPQGRADYRTRRLSWRRLETALTSYSGSSRSAGICPYLAQFPTPTMPMRIFEAPLWGHVESPLAIEATYAGGKSVLRMSPEGPSKP